METGQAEICGAWREDHTIGPIHEAEALHRAWHLREPLRVVCTPGNHELTYPIERFQALLRLLGWLATPLRHRPRRGPK
ncbi:hypothetical protein [Streptomyces sp. x-19]|uniref:hypothetical protein n=1 Tax=Streptomyces sp. x-19 TaxID=2789280 RepID=UPI00397F2811